MSKGRFVDIFVEPDSNEPSGYSFSMEEGGKGASILDFNKNHDGMKKSENYKIEFKLHNKKDANLRFSKIKAKVFWAMEIPGPVDPCPCPPEGSSFPGVYVDPTAFIEDHKLTVINEDREVAHFSFALNFVLQGEAEGPNTNYICYDPIASNQNGGSSKRSSRTLAVGAALVAVGVAGLYACGVFRS